MAQVFTGARALLKIAGKVVGYAGGVNVTVEDTITDVDVLGQLEVGDLAETAHKCNFSVNYFKGVTSVGKAPFTGTTPLADANLLSNTGASFANAADIGVDPSTNSAVSTQNVANLISQAYFDCEVTDEVTDTTIFYMKNCKFEGGTGQVDARGVWQGTMNFKAQKGYGV